MNKTESYRVNKKETYLFNKRELQSQEERERERERVQRERVVECRRKRERIMFDERVSWQRFSTRQRRAVGQSETGFESIAKS